LTPCGSSSCGASYLVMCGNGQCQTFKTAAVYAYDERMTEFCPGPMFFYNIPAYCLKSKAQAYKLTVWYSDEYQVYNDAACFDSVSVVLNPRCLVLNDSIYYSENNANCPKDCNSSLSCFRDYTCVDNPYNCPSAFECCAPGSVRAGTCQDWGMCDIGGFTDSVLSLRNVPIHCACSSDLDCLNDHGGLACCPGGSVHAGFCYSDIFCDST
jgi:hypothetical protein